MQRVRCSVARTAGEVFRRDRLTRQEGGLRGSASPATRTATPSSQTRAGGNFDFNWDR